MGKLILHIGLPKTATTSIQYQILDTPTNRSLYLGKFQSEQSAFHTLVSEYLNGKVDENSAHDEIYHIVSKYEICIYSNEMLTVDSGITWQEKIKKLGILFKGIELQVLVTTRLPSSHAPSLFAELQSLFGWASIDQFLEHSQSDILNINAIDDLLKNSNLARQHSVKYIDFDDLIGSKFSVLTEIAQELRIPNKTSHLNSRKYQTNTIYSRPIGLYDVAYRLSRRMKLQAIVPKKIYHAIGRILLRLPLNWQKLVETNVDGDRLQILDEIYLAASSKYIFIGKDI